MLIYGSMPIRLVDAAFHRRNRRSTGGRARPCPGCASWFHPAGPTWGRRMAGQCIHELPGTWKNDQRRCARKRAKRKDRQKRPRIQANRTHTTIAAGGVFDERRPRSTALACMPHQPCPLNQPSQSYEGAGHAGSTPVGSPSLSGEHRRIKTSHLTYHFPLAGADQHLPAYVYAAGGTWVSVSVPSRSYAGQGNWLSRDNHYTTTYGFRHHCFHITGCSGKHPRRRDNACLAPAFMQ